MVSEIQAAKYPFMKGTGAIAESYGISFDDLGKPKNRGIINKAVVRVVESMTRPDRIIVIEDVAEEIVSFAVAMMYVMRINDKWLTRRFSMSEAMRAEDFLSKEGKDSVRNMARNQFGWDIENLTATQVKTEEEFSNIKYDFKIFFANYLEGIEGLHEDSWKLINRKISKGYVYVTKHQLIRLMRSMVIKLIMGKLSQPINISLPKELEDSLPKITKVLNETKPNMNNIYPTVITESRFPPCIKYILNNLRASINLSHNERFLLTTFLLKIGMDVDTVIDMYDVSPDFNRNITKYQVEFLMGKEDEPKYAPPKCDNIKTQGMCRRDESCHWFHPLEYYSKI